MTTSVFVPSPALNGEIPPGSNTGGNSPSAPPAPSGAIVDTLTFSMPIVALTDDPAAAIMHDDEAIAAALLAAFLALTGLLSPDSLKAEVTDRFAGKGQEVIDRNHQLIDRATAAVTAGAWEEAAHAATA